MARKKPQPINISDLAAGRAAVAQQEKPRALSIDEFVKKKSQAEAKAREQAPKEKGVIRETLEEIATPFGKAAAAGVQGVRSIGALGKAAGQAVIGRGEEAAETLRAAERKTDQPVNIPLLGQVQAPQTVREVVGTGLAVGSAVAPVGRAATLLGRGARLGAEAATFEAGRQAAVGEETDIGRIATSGAFGAALPAAGKAAGKVFRRTKKAPPVPEKVAGKILQADEAQQEIGKRVLTRVDTKGVKTFKDLEGAVQKNIDQNLKKVDAEFAKDTTKTKLDKLSTGESNFVDDALNDLDELYTKTRDPASKKRINALKEKAISQGLTGDEVNRLARQYGKEFGGKAFSKRTGDPLTSVNAQAFENTRKGLKDSARGFLKTKEAQELDRQVSETIRVKTSVAKMKEKVTKLEQRVKERGLIEKISRQLGRAFDVVTFGGPKAFVSKLFFPSNVGQKTLNSLDLQEALAKNLSLLEKLESKNDKQVMEAIIKAMRNRGIKGKAVSALGTSAINNK